jgi:LacI family transcriptional regulator
VATIRDVARRAGVSTATVSYVINGNRPVSEALAARVRAAIEDLSFTPSKVARSLRRGASSIVGLVTDDITNRFAAQLTKGLEAAAAREGYSLIIADLHEDPANEARALGMLLDQRVEGIVYAGFGAAERQLVELHDHGLPVIVVDKPLESGRLPSVLIDNRAGIREALEHLLSIGRRRILSVNGQLINRNSVLRAEAFRAFMTERKLPCPEAAVLWGDFTLRHGFQSVHRLLAAGRRFDALLCGDDVIAFGAMAALKAGGRRVPEDVAVVGFDDDPLAPVFDPSLTTVHYPMREMGQRAFEAFRRMRGKKRGTVECVTLETRLVVRRSTDASRPRYEPLEAGE